MGVKLFWWTMAAHLGDREALRLLHHTYGVGFELEKQIDSYIGFFVKSHRTFLSHSLHDARCQDYFPLDQSKPSVNQMSPLSILSIQAGSVIIIFCKFDEHRSTYMHDKMLAEMVQGISAQHFKVLEPPGDWPAVKMTKYIPATLHICIVDFDLLAH